MDIVFRSYYQTIGKPPVERRPTGGILTFLKVNFVVADISADGIDTLLVTE